MFIADIEGLNFNKQKSKLVSPTISVTILILQLKMFKKVKPPDFELLGVGTSVTEE